MSGISFDRAAAYYDAPRQHPPEVSRQIVAGLQAALPAGAHC